MPSFPFQETKFLILVIKRQNGQSVAYGQMNQISDKIAWQNNDQRNEICNFPQFLVCRKRGRVRPATMRQFHETNSGYSSLFLIGILSGFFTVTIQATSTVASQLDNNNYSRHEFIETMLQIKSNRYNNSPVPLLENTQPNAKHGTKRRHFMLADDNNWVLSEDLDGVDYGKLTTNYRFLLLHRLRKQSEDTVYIESHHEQSSSSSQSDNNGKLFEFHLHPSEITIAKEKRKSLENKNRRKLQSINRTRLSDTDETDYNNELLEYQFNYEWMLDEDAFQKRIINRSQHRRLSDVDNMPNLDHVYHENAVYATIPDQYDPKQKRNRRVREYHSYRHLSRFEKEFRKSNNIDLQANWDGIYTFDIPDDDDDNDDDDMLSSDHDDNISVNSGFDGTLVYDDNNLFTDDDTDDMYREEVQVHKAQHRIFNTSFSEAISSLVLIVKNVQNNNGSHRRLNTKRKLFFGMGKSKDTGKAMKSPALSTIGNNGWTLVGKQHSDLTQISTLGTKDDIIQIEQNDKKAVADEQEAAAASAAAEYIGGQYNNYQAVPLSQGYGTHFANVWVGFPTPQRKTVIVDTGSHYTAFPCTGCTRCGSHHHTDPYFRPELSTTFHQLQCGECRDGVICENGRCLFHQAYTEGSSWEAVQVRDRFFCGGTDVLDSANPDDQQYAIDFMFGCQISMTGLFITQLADGIMGMSAHPGTYDVFHLWGHQHHRLTNDVFHIQPLFQKSCLMPGRLNTTCLQCAIVVN
jgi:Xylanase inhibitor N-terminal